MNLFRLHEETIRKRDAAREEEERRRMGEEDDSKEKLRLVRERHQCVLERFWMSEADTRRQEQERLRMWWAGPDQGREEMEAQAMRKAEESSPEWEERKRREEEAIIWNRPEERRRRREEEERLIMWRAREEAEANRRRRRVAARLRNRIGGCQNPDLANHDFGPPGSSRKNSYECSTWGGVCRNQVGGARVLAATDRRWEYIPQMGVMWAAAMADFRAWPR